MHGCSGRAQTLSTEPGIAPKDSTIKNFVSWANTAILNNPKPLAVVSGVLMTGHPTRFLPFDIVALPSKPPTSGGLRRKTFKQSGTAEANSMVLIRDLFKFLMIVITEFGPFNLGASSLLGSN